MTYRASYVKLLEEGILEERLGLLKELMKECRLCPHNCGVDRKKDLGFCKAYDKALVSNYSPHFGEEEVLVGKRGSGTVFFSYCNMRCLYCQNYTLSFLGQGKAVSNEELADIFLYIQNQYNCHNLNLVTPSHFVANIVEAIFIAAKKGLSLPLVYNCGGYESLEVLKLLDGIVDIYMPDFKYASNERGQSYSSVKGYFDVVKRALLEMDRQVGPLKAQNNIAYRGLLIRHLVLPGNISETKKILDFIHENLSKGVMVNLMDQYYPSNLAFKHPPLDRRLYYEEYEEVLAYAKGLGLRLS